MSWDLSPEGAFWGVYWVTSLVFTCFKAGFIADESDSTSRRSRTMNFC